jgi:hypothetical protein
MECPKCTFGVGWLNIPGFNIKYVSFLVLSCVLQPQQKIATTKNSTVLLAVGKSCTLEPVAFEEYLEVLPFQYFWHCLP